MLKSTENTTASRAQRGAPIRLLAEAVASKNHVDCIIWPFARDYHGRAVIDRAAAHRIVCVAVHGAPPNGKPEAAHSCGNGHLGCINPHHLRWASHAENMAEMVTHGRSPRGERNAMALLTETEVREIVRLRGQVSQRKLAVRFGVSKRTIQDIVEGRNWAWLFEKKEAA